GTSGHRGSFWREGDSRAAAYARQDQPHPSRLENDFPRSAAGFRGHAVSLSDCRKKEPAKGTGNLRRERRPDHGPPPPQNARRRRTVPPRIGPHRNRPANAPKFSKPLVFTGKCDEGFKLRERGA